MSTTQAGDRYERRVLQLLRKELETGRLCLLSECCEVFHKKRYYSRDRQSDIVFDIAIEAYVPGGKKPTLIYLIECKSSTRPIPIDDAEEFFSKAQQVSGANTKSILVSSHGFQKGVLRFAESKGMGLLLYPPTDVARWILNRTPGGLNHSWSPQASATQIALALTGEGRTRATTTALGFTGTTHTDSLTQLFLGIATLHHQSQGLEAPFCPPPAEHTTVDYLSKEDIEARAQSLLARIGYSGGPTPLQEVVRTYERSGLRVRELPTRQTIAGDDVLGQVSFETPTITLYGDDAKSSGRRRFTLAHELAHVSLDHGRYFLRETYSKQEFERLGFGEPTKGDIARLEWQANHLAASLLLPRDHLLEDFAAAARKIGLVDKGFGALYVDSQACNIANYNAVLNPLKLKYRVSRTALHLRMEGLGILTYKRGEYPKRLFGKG